MRGVGAAGCCGQRSASGNHRIQQRQRDTGAGSTQHGAARNGFPLVMYMASLYFTSALLLS